MAKRKRKKLKKKKFWLFRKKTKRRLLLISLALIVGTLLYPDYLPEPYLTKVKNIRQQLSQASIQGQEQAMKILGLATEKLNQTKGFSIPEKPDEIIDRVITDFTQKVKDLPASQVKKIKTQFCSDVIHEATQSSSD